ncbi:MAG TPA: DUF4038 domain-containing protein [Verrucomicrobiae bacterium]|nr:DUF4038 domain-containing protein [Verrucomicrobiae bacterium]
MRIFLPILVALRLLISCEAATKAIIIDPEYPQSFRHANGERFFPLGDTAYFLIAQPTNVIAHYVDVRRKHHFNFVRVLAMADGFWPFGGSPTNPDYTTINEAVMRKWDWVFDYAAARGMYFEVILWGYGVGGGEGLWRREADQNLWIETVVNRFKSRDNLFMFTIANEFERYPDGAYQYDPADVDWARKVAARIRQLDKVHPIGCHPSVWITDQDAPGKAPRPWGRYNDFTQRLPQVVWPLWDSSEININVTQNNEGVQRRTWGDINAGEHGLTYYPTEWRDSQYPVKWTSSGWSFEAPGLQHSMAEDWARGKPVLNLEFGYQFEPGYAQGASYKTRQLHDPSTVRKKAWKIATSGAYFAAGFESAAVRNLTTADVDNFRPEQLETLYNFFTTKTEYWKLTPRHELVASQNALLASEGVEYIAYFPRGGTNEIKLAAGIYQLQWLHPETGRYVEGNSYRATNGPAAFAPPDPSTDDWVLHLRKN